MLTQLWQKYEAYAEDFYSTADPRAAEWPMMNSWWPSFFLCVLYVLAVHYGQVWMKRREAFDVRGFMIAYNFFMVLLSIYLVGELVYCIYMAELSLGCEPVNYSREWLPMRMVYVAWFFYITKFIEMIDTFLFILRKKFHLITFLHVFHHASMPASVWFGIKFVPGGFGSFYPLINTTIHIFMYAYYGIAAAGPKYQKYIWWKKYMTIGQMIQFLLLMLHNGQMFFIECNYPKAFSTAIFTYAFIFLILFSNYFIKAHWKQPKKRESLGAAKSNGHSSEHSVASNGHPSNGTGNGTSNGVAHRNGFAHKED